MALRGAFTNSSFIGAQLNRMTYSAEQEGFVYQGGQEVSQTRNNLPAVKKTMVAWSIMLSAKMPWRQKIYKSFA